MFSLKRKPAINKIMRAFSDNEEGKMVAEAIMQDEPEREEME